MNNVTTLNATDSAANDSVAHATERLSASKEIIENVMGELSLCILAMPSDEDASLQLRTMQENLRQSLSLTGAAQEILTVHGLTYGPKYEREQKGQQRTDSSIHMDAERGRRFHRALGLVFDALYSLGSMPQLFPGCDPQPGEIDPEYAVRSFTMTAEPILLLMLNMIVNEEHLNEQENLPEILRAPVASETESGGEDD